MNIYPYVRKELVRPSVTDDCLQLRIDEREIEDGFYSPSVKQLYNHFREQREQKFYTAQELRALEEQFASLRELAKTLESAYEAVIDQTTAKK